MIIWGEHSKSTPWHVHPAKAHPRSLIRVCAIRMKNHFGPSLPIGGIAKTLIRLRGCAGWTESSMGANANLYLFGSFSKWFCAYAISSKPHKMAQIINQNFHAGVHYNHYVLAVLFLNHVGNVVHCPATDMWNVERASPSTILARSFSENAHSSWTA